MEIHFNFSRLSGFELFSELSCPVKDWVCSTKSLSCLVLSCLLTDLASLSSERKIVGAYGV